MVRHMKAYILMQASPPNREFIDSLMSLSKCIVSGCLPQRVRTMRVEIVVHCVCVHEWYLKTVLSFHRIFLCLGLQYETSFI